LTVEETGETRPTAPDDVAGILAALNTDAGLPQAALTAAAAHWDEIRPALHAQIQAYIDGTDRSERAADLAFLAIYLMAQQRDTSAFALICALARDAEAPEAVLNDGLTDDLNSILVRLFDGDAALLRAVIEAEDANEFARHAAFEALAWLTAAGRIDRAETTRYLGELFTTLQPRNDSWAWVGWQQAIADLGLTELAPLARTAFKRGWIGDYVMSVTHFEEDLKKGCEASEPMEALAPRFRSLAELDDITTMMADWACFEPVEDRPRPAPPPPVTRLPATELPFIAGPIRNPLRGVGRNDPCPCGSGKKFKKCCLGKA
jgi:hypothetical protein